ncbi:MAG: hypothetical protein D4R95_00170 [Actinobacteria bacterium]|nr:MAG: hypothetical protein D4R95_00170 [Actinomycetota bacterium]
MRVLGPHGCHTAIMYSIDPKKWFDRMQPQTLQIATWLLYFDGFFALMSVLDETGHLGYLRYRYSFGVVVGLVSVALYALGGFLMANERKIGYKLGIAAAVSPIVLRFFAVQAFSNNSGTSGPVRLTDYVTGRVFGGSAVSVAFDIAVIALLLHTQSREHQRIWYR